MQDISTWILKGQVTVPTEASRSPGEEFEISKDTSDGQGLDVYHVWYYGLRKWDLCQAQDQDVSQWQKWCEFLSQTWYSHHNCTRLCDTKLHGEPCALANLEFETIDSWPLEILCTSDLIWLMAWTIFGTYITCTLLVNLYKWIVILVILFYRLKSLIYSRATRVKRTLFGCFTLNKEFTIPIDSPTKSGTYNFTVIIIFSSQESTSDRWLITCTSGGGSKNQAWKGIKDEPSIVSF